MPELEDYSGEFKPDLKITDFSKTMVGKYAIECSKLYLLLSGLWFNYLRDNFSVEMADHLHWEVWETLGDKHENWRPARAMYISMRPDTVVEDAMKWVQIDPGVGLVFDMEFELKDKTHGIVTIKDCNALRYMEKHGDTALQENACGLDIWGFPKAARGFHPDLRMNCIKCAPRKSPDEPACVWEVTVDPEHRSLVNPDLPEYAQRAQAKSDWDQPMYPVGL
jgi:hypothetical protein